MVKLWSENTPSWLLFVHFGFGLGTIIGPAAAEPFQSDRIVTSHVDHDACQVIAKAHHVMSSNASQLLQHAPCKSRLYVPFSTFGSVALASAALFFTFHFLPINKRLTGREKHDNHNNRKLSDEREDVDKTSVEDESENKNSDVSGVYRTQMVVLLFLMYVMIVANNTMLSVFIFTIAVDTSLAFTSHAAVLVTTSYWLCFAGSRLVFALVSRCIKIQVSDSTRSFYCYKHFCLVPDMCALSVVDLGVCANIYSPCFGGIPGLMGFSLATNVLGGDVIRRLRFRSNVFDGNVVREPLHLHDAHQLRASRRRHRDW